MASDDARKGGSRSPCTSRAPEGVSHFLTVVYFGLGKEQAAEPTGA
jgi:hypothetical protein